MSNQQFESIKDSVRDNLKGLVDTGSEKAAALKDSTVYGVKKLGKLIKQHPIAAIAIAFGAGFIIMRLARR